MGGLARCAAEGRGDWASAGLLSLLLGASVWALSLRGDELLPSPLTDVHTT